MKKLFRPETVLIFISSILIILFQNCVQNDNYSLKENDISAFGNIEKVDYLPVESIIEECGPGFSLNAKGVCVSNCEVGFIQVNNSCVRTCGDGYALINDSCIKTCADGYVLVNDSCERTCSEGYTLLNDSCIKTCADGYTLNNSTCERTCSEGYILVDNSCVKSCNEGYSLVDNSCVKTCDSGYVLNTTTDQCEYISGCNSYVELSGDALVVPAKTTEKICYYKKVVSESRSSLGSNSSINVMWWHGSMSTRTISNPRILGDFTSTLTLQGQRKIEFVKDIPSLTASSTTNLYTTSGSAVIDNMLVVKLSDTSNNSSVYWGFGTSDCLPMVFNPGQESELKIQSASTNYSSGNNYGYYGSNSTGGYVNVSQDDIMHFDYIRNFLTPNRSIQLSVQALDCGGGLHTTDVYTIFK
jgi:hypothetical protein